KVISNKKYLYTAIGSLIVLVFITFFVLNNYQFRASDDDPEAAACAQMMINEGYNAPNATTLCSDYPDQF
ncbi:MAG: hypothetical protein WCK26_04000, partial [Candidatus Saccharibacteria bacterium]